MQEQDRKTLKTQLVEKRSQLLQLLQKTEDYGREIVEPGDTRDLADQASYSYTKEFLFKLSSHDRRMLAQISGALLRMENGDYGQCLQCRQEIGLKRLQAVPWTELCVGCQRAREQDLKSSG